MRFQILHFQLQAELYSVPTVGVSGLFCSLFQKKSKKERTETPLAGTEFLFLNLFDYKKDKKKEKEREEACRAGSTH